MITTQMSLPEGCALFTCPRRLSVQSLAHISSVLELQLRVLNRLAKKAITLEIQGRDPHPI